MSGYKARLLFVMPKCQAYFTATVAAATNHSLAPSVTLYVAAVHVTSKSLPLFSCKQHGSMLSAISIASSKTG